MDGIEAIPHIDEWRKAPSHLKTFLMIVCGALGNGFEIITSFSKRKMQGYKKI